MKYLVLVLIALNANFAMAHHTAFHKASIEACKAASPMAVLAKDNYPYWAPAKVDETTAAECYDFVMDVTEFGSKEEITLLQQELKGQLKIYKNDKDFARFITEQEDYEQMKIENPHNVRPHLIPLVNNSQGFFTGAN